MKQSQDSMISLQILNPLASSSCLLCTFIAYSLNAIITVEKNVYGYNDAKAETPVLWPPHAKS